MLYIGNFSYDEAMEKFAAHLHEVRKTSDLLDGAHEIYLDSLTELEGVPSDPVICQWQKIVPAMDGLCSITSALPVADEDSDLANAYAWGDEDDEREHAHHDDLDDLDEEDLMDQEPFLLFE